MTEPLLQADADSQNNREMDPVEWVDRHGDYLYRYALRHVQRPEAAEDLVQETLLAAWKGRDSFIGQASERSWLTAILKRKVIDWLRRTVRERTASVDMLPVKWANDPFTQKGKWRTWPNRWAVAAPETDLERDEFWAVVRQCSSKLAPRLREVFHLWYLDERTADEVCRTTGVTQANLWVMLHRSRLGMWQCLTTNWYGQPASEQKGG